MKSTMDKFNDKKISRDFTVSAYIVYKDKTLLHWHKKLSLWLPVGGHIEINELPEEAILREVKEETGLDVQIYQPDPSLNINDAKQLKRPTHILLEDIEKFHQHIDFVYYATCKTASLNPIEGESLDFKWLISEEVKLMELPANVKVCALEVLSLMKEQKV